MNKRQKNFSPQEKALVALAAIKGDQTIAQISSGYQIHSTQISSWKKQAIDNFSDLFKNNKKKEKQNELDRQAELDNLYKMIGQRDMELEWLKKKLSIFNHK